MTQIKRGTTPTIRARMEGIRPEDVGSVEFIVKPFVTDAGHELLHWVSAAGGETPCTAPPYPPMCGRRSSTRQDGRR